MATIYKNPQGIDVYDDPIKGVVSVKTGQSLTADAITTSVLSPTSSPTFQTSTPTPVTDITKIDSTPPAPTPEPMKLTPQEQVISDEEKAYREGNLALQGQAAFRAEQEAALITPEMRKTQIDLSARLKALQNEALAIPLQLEKDFQGRADIGSIQGFSREAVRQNAIQALGVSSLLEASRGNLALAQDLVDRAVQQKFGPLEEAQKTKLANLESLRRDPRLTVEQQDRLEKQKKIQEAEKANTELEKQKFEDARKEALKYAGVADALTIREMEKAKTALEVAQIARRKGLKTLEQQKAEQEIAKLKAEAKAKAPLVGVSPITQSIINNPSLFDDLTPTAKGTVIAQLQAQGYDTSNLGVKGLSDTAIKEIAQTQKALSDLDELRVTIKGNEQFIGPITGLQRFNPYSKARRVQADVDRVKQTVGKALEGGVLRKEDEEKYKKILATLSDTPETAIYKIDALVNSIQRDIENYKSLQQASGKSLDIKKSLEKKGTIVSPEDLRKKYGY